MKMGSFLVWERGLNTQSKKCRHLTMFDNEYWHISKDLEDYKDYKIIKIIKIWKITKSFQ